VKFWDTSAIVPLLVEEPATAAIQQAYRDDPLVLVAWTTAAECASAIARAEHDDLIDEAAATAAFDRLDDLAGAWREVEPSHDVRAAARRLLRVHRLRAADAVQLGSAILASQHKPGSIALVTLDDRLAAVARREGFVVYALPRA
jgi:predicted nucleic acid-binding protein